MDREQIFHRDPDILGGTPVFVGTRVPVESLIHHLKHGKRLEEFLVLNGYEVEASVDEQERIFLSLAAGEIEREEFADWVKAHLAEHP